MNKLYSIILGVFCLVALAATAASVTLAWDPNCDPSVTGYRVYYGTNSVLVTNVMPAYVDDCGNSRPQSTNTYHTPYTLSVPSSGGRTNCSVAITNLIPTVTYSFVVVATNGAGLESDYSNEVRYTVPLATPPQPPSVLKFP